MVDEEAAADLRTRVDVDAGGRVGDFRADPRQQRQAGAIQMVRQAVVDHRQDAGVAQQHLIHAAGRRVAVIGRQHIGVQQHPQAGQGQGEILDQADRPA